MGGLCEIAGSRFVCERVKECASACVGPCCEIAEEIAAVVSCLVVPVMLRARNRSPRLGLGREGVGCWRVPCVCEAEGWS